MRRVIGQAAGHAGRQLHGLSRLVLLLVLLAVAAGMPPAAGPGPLAVPWLAGRIAATANRHIAPLRLEIGEASLVWEGFSRGVDRPLDIRALDVAVYDADSRRLAQVPEVELSLSMRALATGRIAPRGLLVQGAQVRMLRRADGSVAVDFSGTPDGDAVPQGPSADDRTDFGWVFAALGQPAGTDLEGSRACWGSCAGCSFAGHRWWCRMMRWAWFGGCRSLNWT